MNASVGTRLQRLSTNGGQTSNQSQRGRSVSPVSRDKIRRKHLKDCKKTSIPTFSGEPGDNVKAREWLWLLEDHFELVESSEYVPTGKTRLELRVDT